MTILIALVVTYIAFRQWKTADQRLKLDLFDRRYEVYKLISQHFGAIKGSGKVGDDQSSQFLLDVEVTRWIFDNEIHWYLHQKVWKRMSDLKLLEDMIIGTNREDGSKRANLEKQNHLKDQLEQDRKNLDQMFKSYLEIGKHNIL